MATIVKLPWLIIYWFTIIILVFSVVTRSFQWNRDHVVVSIDSVQDENDAKFPILLKLFNGSARILLPSISNSDRNYLSSFLATESVSNFNRWKTGPTSRLSPEPAIESFMRAPVANLANAGGLARMANLLFPGTVKTILIDTERTQDSSKPDSTLDEIPTSFPWKENGSLGVIFPIRNCMGPVELIYEKLVDKNVRIVLFTFWPDPIDIDTGVQRNVSKTLSEFEICEAKVKSYSAQRSNQTEKLNLGFLTGWQGNCLRPDEERFAEQLTFWKTMNDWAVKKDLTVFLKYMVCGSGRNETDRWWRWVQNRTDEWDFLSSTPGRNDSVQQKELVAELEGPTTGNRTVEYKAQKFNRAWASSTTATDCSEPRIENDETVVRLVTTCSVTTTITLFVKGAAG